MKRQIRPIHDKFMTWSDDLVLHLSIFAPIAIGHIGLLLIGNKFRVQQWVVWGNSFVAFGVVALNYVKSHNKATELQFSIHHSTLMKLKDKLTEILRQNAFMEKVVQVLTGGGHRRLELKKQGDPIIEIGREDNKFGEEDNDWAASNGDARNELTVYEDHSSSETWTCRRRSQEEAFSCFETRPQRVDEPSARYNEILYQVVLEQRNIRSNPAAAEAEARRGLSVARKLGSGR
ncbi:hypothetical protein GIB67_008538 [Kingdonia uniflora]|uniref:Uncharacterized protein n=1 Tax=Kingdonia uniflora TaxID=39325 RepID=A0A7J7LFB6_9MAGN|nr:hypothetical protein GIB67_008538 [Kingdonia uniflora]